MKKSFTSGRMILALALTTASFGCRSAVSSVDTPSVAAGETAEIIVTGESAASVIAGSMGDVDRRTRRVLLNMGLQFDDGSDEDNATEREYEARNADRVVHVKLEQRPGTLATNLTVSSRNGSTYEVNHARTVIQQVQNTRTDNLDQPNALPNQ